MDQLTDQLETYGWTDEVHQKWIEFASPGLQPARVIADFGTSLKVVTLSRVEDDNNSPIVMPAELSGKLAHYSGREHIPKVGDWIVLRASLTDRAVVEAVLPRHSEIARKAAGSRTVKQVIAANIDVAFVVLALDNDFSIERLRRYLYQLSQNFIQPVIVLNKADKTPDVQSYISQLYSLDLPMIVCVATEGKGIAEVLAHIGYGKTAVLLGSSGVGKSTLTNQLLGYDAQSTQAVHESDATGRHTTVHRELFILPNGGLLIDTPGIRELQLWGSEDELHEDFDDVALLISRCKYANCTHTTEPDCAIRQSLATEVLKRGHYASYIKMKGELAGLQQRKEVRTKLDNQRSRRSTQQRDRSRRSDDNTT
jgi:ribosome biogenesis GTPase